MPSISVAIVARRRPPLGALEEHVLGEMGDAADVRGLVARAGGEHDEARDGLGLRHRRRQHADAVGEGAALEDGHRDIVDTWRRRAWDDARVMRTIVDTVPTAAARPRRRRRSSLGIVLLGVWAVRRWIPSTREGFDAEVSSQMLGVVASLFGLLLAFVVVIEFQAFSSAGDNVQSEADDLGGDRPRQLRLRRPGRRRRSGPRSATTCAPSSTRNGR